MVRLAILCPQMCPRGWTRALVRKGRVVMLMVLEQHAAARSNFLGRKHAARDLPWLAGVTGSYCEMRTAAARKEII